jgi:putative zinc finger/helix-turn-helix YgiT family protein
MNTDFGFPGVHQEARLLECPECGEHAVRTEQKKHNFTYGRGSDARELEVVLPVRVCGQCGFQYLDKAANDAQHDAVCRHLGVLTPTQIRALREYHGLSRAEFASMTRLGEATIARWERGSLIQNGANDWYLRLIGFEENMSRLRKWTHCPSSADSAPEERLRPATFPTLNATRMAELRLEQMSFRP